MDSTEVSNISTEPTWISTEPKTISTEATYGSTEAANIEVTNGQAVPLSDEGLSTEAKEINRTDLMYELPFIIQGKISQMKERESFETMQELILEICSVRFFKLAELGSILGSGG